MKRKMKFLVIISMILALCVSKPNIESKASALESWRIKITKPTSVSDVRMMYVNMYYYSGGYRAYCSRFDGENGAIVTISTLSIFKMPQVRITKTGYTKNWTVNNIGQSTVKYTVAGDANYCCDVAGNICLN